MKCYVASSWRNVLQPTIVAALRDLGHRVYDFRNPGPDDRGFSWSEVHPGWKITDGEKGHVDAATYRKILAHPLAEAGYELDIAAVRAADVGVYVLPCGRSASWEFGYLMGQGKPCYVVWFGEHEPELMFREATVIGSMEELREAFGETCPACDGQSPSAELLDLQFLHTGDTSGACGVCNNTHVVAVGGAGQPETVAALRSSTR